MLPIIKISFLNIFRRKSRTILSLLGIIIGIASLIVLVSLVNGIYEDTAKTIGKMQTLIVFKEDAKSPVFDTFEDNYQQKLKSITGVKEVIPELIQLVGYIDNKKLDFTSPQNAVRLFGIPTDKINLTFSGAVLDNLIKGRTITKNSKNKIVISDKLADDYHKTINSTIKIDGKKYTIIGIFKANSQTEEGMIFARIQDLRNNYKINNKRISLYEIYPYNPNDSKKIKKKIELMFPELKVMGQQEMLETIGSIVNSLKLLVIIVSIVAAIVAGIGVINTMLMSVMERTKEIGTLKAIGWTKTNIIFMVVLEASFIGILGGIFGLITGYIGSFLITTYLLIPTHITLSLMINSFLFAFALGTIGGFYPAYIASKLDPIEALREE